MPTKFEDNQQPLTARASAQLLLDIEANPAGTCKEICTERPAFYGGIYLRASRNRFAYLKDLKKTKRRRTGNCLLRQDRL